MNKPRDIIVVGGDTVALTVASILDRSHDVTVISDNKAPYLTGPYRFHGYNDELISVLDDFDVDYDVDSRKKEDGSVPKRPRLADYRIALYDGKKLRGWRSDACISADKVHWNIRAHNNMYYRSRGIERTFSFDRASSLGDSEAFAGLFADTLQFDTTSFHRKMAQYLRPIEGKVVALDTDTHVLKTLNFEHEVSYFKYDALVLCVPRWEFPSGLEISNVLNTDYSLVHVISFRTEKMLSLFNDVIYPTETEVIHRLTFGNGLWYAEFNAQYAPHDALLELTEIFGDYNVDSITTQPIPGYITDDLPDTVMDADVHAIGRFATFDQSETLADSAKAANELGAYCENR